MSATAYLEAAIAAHIFEDGPAYARPTELHVVLFTIMPDDDGVGGVEPAATTYVPVLYGPDALLWERNPVTGIVTNLDFITYPDPAAEGWGTIIGVGIRDQLGTLLFDSLLALPKVVLANGPAPEFRPGTLSITID